jgi:hypothetical protein
MLAYLEDLCAALLAHDAVAIHRLLADPLARSLPRQVREEALAISRAHPSSLRAPIQTLRFYHQSLQMGEDSGPSESPGGDRGDPDATGVRHETDAERVERARPAPPHEQRRVARRGPRTAERDTPDTPDAPGGGAARPDDERREQIELPFDCAAAA